MNLELLKDKNFFILVLGRFISLVGSSLLSFALSLYVLSTTGSGAKFASVLALSGLTSLVLTPISGVLADWFDRKKIMVIVDFISGITVLLFFLISVFSTLEVAHVYMIVVILAALTAADTPAVQSAVPSLVSKEKIAGANSLNVLVQTLAQIIAPILGGILYSIISMKGILLIAVITFICTAVLETFMEIPSQLKVMNKKWHVEFVTDFKEGLVYVYNNKIIRWVVVVAIFANLISPILSVGFPYVIKIDLGLSNAEYGTFQGLFILGILIGSIISAKLTSKMNLIKLLSAVIIAFGVLASITGFMVWPGILTKMISAGNVNIVFIIMCVSILCIGIVLTLFNIAVQTSVQKETPNQLIGRVFGVIVTLCMSLTPIGQMIYGLLFDRNNSSIIILVSSVILVIVGALSMILYIKGKRTTMILGEER